MGEAASDAQRWRRCSACKKDIALGAVHWVCSVSTCNRKRTGLVFCTVDCWEVHLPTERHRESWAVEARAPKVPDPPEGKPAAKTSSPSKPASSTAKSSPSGSTVAKPGPPSASASSSRSGDKDILVVASRLKAYIRQASGFSTSDRVLPRLSDALRTICDESIEQARRAERQTVMDRDVPPAGTRGHPLYGSDD